MAKKKEEPVVFINPFDNGVGYDVFLKSIPDNVTLDFHCKNYLTKEQIAFLLEELKHYKKNINLKK